MYAFKKQCALLLALVMVITMLPAMPTVVAASNVSVLTCDSFISSTKIHTGWATGHNTMFQLTNTGSQPWYHWVFSVNRPLGLAPYPNTWWTIGGNNILVVHEDQSETTFRNLGHNAPVLPGQTLTFNVHSDTTPSFMPTDFRVRPAEQRLVPLADFEYEIFNHSEWPVNQFNHAIELRNRSNRIIQNWEIHFDIAGGMYIESVPNAAIIQTTSGSAILAYVPGGGQVQHPGQVLHLGMIGTFVPGSYVTNVRVYERVGTPYGGWPAFVPTPPETTPPTGTTTAQPTTTGNTGATTAPTSPPDNTDPGDTDPEDPVAPRLFITTNDRGSVFTDLENYNPGDVINLTIIPDRGYFLYTQTATVGTLNTENRGATFTYTMPNQDVHLHFTFMAAEADPPLFPLPEIPPYDFELSIRHFRYEDVVESTIHDNFRFVSGEIIVIAHRALPHFFMEDMVSERGGEIVGFLELANTYQLYFTGTTEAELNELVDWLNGNELVILASLNIVGETSDNLPYEYGNAPVEEVTQQEHAIISPDCRCETAPLVSAVLTPMSDPQIYFDRALELYRSLGYSDTEAASRAGNYIFNRPRSTVLERAMPCICVNLFLSQGRVARTASCRCATLQTHDGRGSTCACVLQLQQVLNANAPTLQAYSIFPTRVGERVPNDARWQNPSYNRWFYNNIPQGLSWGMEAINAPMAWYYLIDDDMNLRDGIATINVGVIDTMFGAHEDLSITKFENILPTSTSHCYVPDCVGGGRNLCGNLHCQGYNPFRTARHVRHGIHVAGTIGATFNNDLGVTGVAPNVNLFSYSMSSNTSVFIDLFHMKHALATLFAQDVRVINVSMGFSFGWENPNPHLFNIYHYVDRLTERDMLTEFLRLYLDIGTDFLIVQAAGNDSHKFIFDGEIWYDLVHIGYSGLFVNIVDPDIRSRIILVGNMSYYVVDTETVTSELDYIQQEVRFAANPTTQIGNSDDNDPFAPDVDIFAPGTRIDSTSFDLVVRADIDLNAPSSHYETLTGTSMAAPHVAGVAALLLGLNPDLSGSQLRDIILNQTHRASIAINAPGGRRYYSVLCAATAVAYVAEGVEGEAPASGDYATVFGIVHSPVDMLSPMYNREQPAKIEIFRRISNNYLEEVPNAIVGWDTETGTRIEVDTPVVTSYMHVINNIVDGGWESYGFNTFSITLPRAVYLFQVSGLEGHRTTRVWVDLTGHVPFQRIVLLPGSDITITVDSEIVYTAPMPGVYPAAFLDQDRLMAPLRPLAEGMDFGVYWRDPTREAALYYGDNMRIVMPIDGAAYRVYNLQTNEFTKHLFADNIPPRIINNRTFLPVSSVARASGRFDTQWIEATSTAALTTRPAFAAFGTLYMEDTMVGHYQAGPVMWRGR